MHPETELPYYEEIRVYGARLLGNQTDADDFVQEVYARFFSSGKQIEGLYLRNWLFRTARNLAIDIYRNHTRLPINNGADIDALPEKESKTTDPASIVEQQELLSQVLTCLKDSSKQTRRIFYQRFVEGQSSAQICPALGIGASTVRKILAGTIAQMREAFYPDE